MLILIDYLKNQHNIDTDALLKQADIDPERIKKKQRYLSQTQYVNLMTITLQQVDRQTLIADLTENMQMTQHGLLGLLAMCGITIRTAVKAMLRFYHLQIKLVDIKYTEQDDHVIIQVDPVGNLGATEQFTLEFGLMVLLKGKQQLISTHGFADEVYISYPQDQDSKLITLFPNNTIHFNQPNNQIQSPIAHLDMRLTFGNKPTFEMLHEQCDQLLAADHQQHANITHKIATLLAQSDNQLPNLEQMAQILSMSTRTLSRQLHKQDCTYQLLLDRERIRRAKELLTYTDATITDVATDLYFTDSSHFSKVFKRLTSKSPTEYRES